MGRLVCRFNPGVPTVLAIVFLGPAGLVSPRLCLVVEPRTAREAGVGVVILGRRIRPAGTTGVTCTDPGVGMITLSLLDLTLAALAGRIDPCILTDNRLFAPDMVSPRIAVEGVEGIRLVLATNRFLFGVTLPDLDACRCKSVISVC